MNAVNEVDKVEEDKAPVSHTDPWWDSHYQQWVCAVNDVGLSTGPVPRKIPPKAL